MKDDKKKAILLVNMPDKCKDCEFYHEFECTGRCRLNSGFTEKDKKPAWCPLVPLPQKKELSLENWDYDIRASAWNSCIDTITGIQRSGEGLKNDRKELKVMQESLRKVDYVGFIRDSSRNETRNNQIQESGTGNATDNSC